MQTVLMRATASTIAAENDLRATHSSRPTWLKKRNLACRLLLQEVGVLQHSFGAICQSQASFWAGVKKKKPPITK
jgi:hypothetical protein